MLISGKRCHLQTACSQVQPKSPNLHYTGSTPAVHLHYTCIRPAVHLQYTCITPALHLPYTCITPAAPLRYTCIASAAHLHYTCVTPALQPSDMCVSEDIALCRSCQRQKWRMLSFRKPLPGASSKTSQVLTPTPHLEMCAASCHHGTAVA